jgi:ribose transport system ATP-binding protein
MPLEPFLYMKGISKAFPGVVALDNVDFDLCPGEVHGLVGENGAGKSTLIKILSGIYIQDQGEIVLNGEPIALSHPSDAREYGISPVHQELNLEPYLTAAENIFLGHQPLGRFGLINHQKMNRDAQELLENLGVDVAPRRMVAELAVAQRQLVSIAHAVSIDAKIVIMDEPTSPLTERETEMLFNIIRNLKQSGIAIVYISHRLEEVFEIADRVTVLRDGKLIKTMPVSETNLDEVISLMIGRSVSELFQKEIVPIGEPVLKVQHLYRQGFLENISFTLRQGEIIGLFGLAGAGRTDLARVLFGAEPMDEGEILLNGTELRSKTPNKSIKMGLGLIPEDRREHGLVVKQSVKANITLPMLSVLSVFGLISPRAETQLAEKYVDQLQIRTPSINQQVMYLSGGNQQRVVIAKWLATTPKVLILDEPTKGIDIGAKASIHGLMCDMARKGVGILMISSELPEILGMSDRILVMHRGKITGDFPREGASEENIMRAATGELIDVQH